MSAAEGLIEGMAFYQIYYQAESGIYSHIVCSHALYKIIIIEMHYKQFVI